MFWTSKNLFGRPKKVFGRPTKFLDVQKMFWKKILFWTFKTNFFGDIDQPAQLSFELVGNAIDLTKQALAKAIFV